MSSVVKSKSSPQDGITSQISDLSLGAVPRAKSKNLNVVQEFEKLNKKNAASFVVIGQQNRRSNYQQ